MWRNAQRRRSICRSLSAVDVHAPSRLARAAGRIAVVGHGKLGDLADADRHGRRRIAGKLDRHAGRLVGAAGVDPVGDAVDVGGRHRPAAPWQRREAATVERRLAAQSLDQAGRGAARAGRRTTGVSRRRRCHHFHAEELRILQRARTVGPEPAGAAVIGRAVTRSVIQYRFHARIRNRQCSSVHFTPPRGEDRRPARRPNAEAIT